MQDKDYLVNTSIVHILFYNADLSDFDNSSHATVNSVIIMGLYSIMEWSGPD